MKNKKVFIYIALIIIIVIVITTLRLLNKETNDNQRFEKEYYVKVPKYTKVIYLTDDNIIEALSTQDKLIFLGDKEAKTKEAVSVLLETAEDKVIDKIYYYETNGIKEKKDIYTKLIEKLEKTELVSPSLFLVKDKKVDTLEEGVNSDIKDKYKKIMVAYLMCTSENC